MKQATTIVIACLFSAVIAYFVVSSNRQQVQQLSAQRSVLDRIQETKTLRCGYVAYDPLIIKDPKTGEISGIGADIHKFIATILGVQIVWSAEASWSTYLEDLKAGRYDMLCDMDFWFPGYSAQISTNVPVLYTLASAWTRPEIASRFLGKGHDAFDSPDVTISAVDGTMPMTIAREDFPKAKVLSLPPLTDYSFNIVNVLDKKADVTFVENVFAESFLKTHPNALVNVTPDAPLRVYAYSIPTLPGDVKMKSAMENIIGYMIDNNIIDAILKKYGVEDGYRVAARPYREVR